ncbi:MULTISPECIES: hypothetical protein [Bradyrhizobium]|uniref:hypothetical protein n=1 Tax=Bradyrhizobium TaxID=374 RepID=UPI001EDBA71B|nr:hypothetical protein [Bradyrhizobium zhengyangense]MCG2645813.1 hypothetical protein [Bradyrhizobium zhengyangense]
MPATFSVQAFAESIGFGLVDAFKHREPVEFVVLAARVDYRGHAAYSLTSPYIELTEAALNRVQRVVSLHKEHGPDGKEEAKRLYQQELEIALEGFHISGSVILEDGLNCVRVRCDPRTRTAHLQPFSPRSTKPQDYPNRLSYTSEILEYAVALLNAKYLIVDADDPALQNLYPLVKLLSRFMDHHSIDLGHFRVNDADPEEWDFENAELDYELGTSRKD